MIDFLLTWIAYWIMGICIYVLIKSLIGEQK